MFLQGFYKFPIIRKNLFALKLQIILNQDFFECTKKTNAMSLQKRGIKMSEFWRPWRATYGDFPVLRRPPHNSCSQNVEWMNRKKNKNEWFKISFYLLWCWWSNFHGRNIRSSDFAHSLSRPLNQVCWVGRGVCC